MNVEKVLEKLNLEHKVKLISGRDFWHTEELEDPYVPSITVSDGPHGLRISALDDIENDSATSYPIEAAMAATWNEELVEKAGKCIGDECQYYGIDVLLAPGVNGKRTPVGGRNFEYFSADPFLSGRMATAYVRGVQSCGVGTSLKHFAANEQETNRMVVSSEVDERTLREIYLYPFEMVVKNEEPWTVMCAYNKINGIYMSQNKRFLKEILRKEWGFSGLVVSDWGAVDDRASGIKSGLDLEMPGPCMSEEEIIEAVRKKELEEEYLDECVRNVLKLIDKAVKNRKKREKCDFEAHHNTARRVAEESIVLLKNEKDILPLNSEQDVAIVGKYAKKPRFQGGGSSCNTPARLENFLEEIEKYTDVDYVPGYGKEDVSVNKELLEAACDTVRNKGVVLVFVGTTEAMESEGYDREDISLPFGQIELIKELAAVNDNIVLITASGSAIDLNEVDDYVKGIIHTWLYGQAGGSALANIIFGKVNPSGKLSETFPLKYEHNPAYLFFPGDVEKVEYNEGIFTDYRYYDRKKLPVQYPFGYGLSYTDFKYSNLDFSSTTLKSGEELIVSFDVKNTGDVEGKEVVQVYVKDIESTVERPEKELKGFSKINLSPGEQKKVSIKLNKRAFSYYCEKNCDFVVESGEFNILVGSSSRDIRLNDIIKFESDDSTGITLTEEHRIELFYKDPEMDDKMRKAMKMMGLEKGDRFYEGIMGMPVRKALKILKIDYNTRKEINSLLGLE